MFNVGSKFSVWVSFQTAILTSRGFQENRGRTVVVLPLSETAFKKRCYLWMMLAGGQRCGRRCAPSACLSCAASCLSGAACAAWGRRPSRRRTPSRAAAGTGSGRWPTAAPGRSRTGSGGRPPRLACRRTAKTTDAAALSADSGRPTRTPSELSLL